MVNGRCLAVGEVKYTQVLYPLAPPAGTGSGQNHLSEQTRTFHQPLELEHYLELILQ